MRRLATAVAAVMLFSLAGCGDPTEDYCNELKQDRKEFAEMLDSDSSSALLGNLPMLRDLAEKSPDDLSDEWQTYLSAIEGLDKAIERAGVKPSDFDDGKAPSGLSATDKKAIAEAAGQITTEEVIAAASGIEQQARDVCKVNLGL
jgi:hypothetical protein